jgi:hypothetical protein
VVACTAACAPTDQLAGRAALVGNATLTADAIQAASTEVLTLAATTGDESIDTGALNRAQVATWVQEELAALAAARAGIEVTDGEVDRFLADIIRTNGTTRAEFERAVALQADFWVPPSGLETYARAFLQQQLIGQEVLPDGTPEEQTDAAAQALTDVGNDVGVRIAPRFGTWNATSGQVLAPEDDLSVQPTQAPEVPEGFVPNPSQG